MLRRIGVLCAMLVASTSGLARSQPAPGTAEEAADTPTAFGTPVSRSIGAVVDRAAKKAVTTLSPGLAIAVLRDGKVEAARGYGVASLARGASVTPDTRFEIGSITKQFTAACVALLVRAKKLSLDDRLGTYVPSYVRGRDVTLRDLLGQRSGVPEYLDIDGVSAEAARPTTFDALLKIVASKPLLFEPGTHWAYSNTNYMLLGRVIEVASGESYEAYVRRHIFEPLGMTHSGFIGDGMDPDRTADGYVFLENTTEKRLLGNAPSLDESWAGAAGGIVSTLGDIAAWDAALASGKILTVREVASMRTAGTLANGSSTGYGYGWIVDDVEGHARLWHNGGTYGFHAVNAVYPSDGLAIIVFANEAGAPVEDIATDIFLRLTPDAAARRATAGTDEDAAITARVREWIGRMQTGIIDRAQLTDAMNKTFTAAQIGRTTEEFGAFGKLERLVFKVSHVNCDATAYTYLAGFSSTALSITIAIDRNGKIAMISIAPS